MRVETLLLPPHVARVLEHLLERALPHLLDFGLWRSYSAVTVSPSGPRKLFKGVTTATSGVLARFPLLLPVRNSFASYGASAVARTSDRGHVAEVSKPNSSKWRGLNPGFQRNPSPP